MALVVLFATSAIAGCSKSKPQPYACGCHLQTSDGTSSVNLKVCSDQRGNAMRTARACARTYAHEQATSCNCRAITSDSCQKVDTCLGKE